MNRSSRRRRNPWKSASVGLGRWRKTVMRSFRYKPGRAKPILMVLGCPRSGTTLLTHMFDLDSSSRVYRTDEGLFDKANEVSPGRLRPLPWVQERLLAERAAFIQFKPQVESQRARELLEGLPESRIIWLYRHFMDVGRSTVSHGRGKQAHRNIQPIIQGDPDDWRCQNLDPATRETISGLYRPDLDPMSVAALFWYARNSLYFQQDLASLPRVCLMRYDDLVNDAMGVMEDVYDWMELPFPARKLASFKFSSSIGRGRGLEIDPAVKALGDELLDRFSKLPHVGIGGANLSLL